jgi:CTP:molybdopterin cytidylyltransferase MocA
MRILAVVLAAGEGCRVGGPKALLRIQGQTFLRRTTSLLTRPGIDAVLAVLGCEAERVQAESGLAPDVEVVVNARWRDGMLGSILAGLDAAERRGAEAIMVHAVDHPFVQSETVDAVVAALGAGAWVAVPVFEGRRGHPAGFARPAWDALRQARPERGARGVLADHPDWVAHLPSGPGCVDEVNTPEDLARLADRL